MEKRPGVRQQREPHCHRPDSPVVPLHGDMAKQGCRDHGGWEKHEGLPRALGMSPHLKISHPQQLVAACNKTNPAEGQGAISDLSPQDTPSQECATKHLSPLQTAFHQEAGEHAHASQAGTDSRLLNLSAEKRSAGHQRCHSIASPAVLQPKLTARSQHAAPRYFQACDLKMFNSIN